MFCKGKLPSATGPGAEGEDTKKIKGWIPDKITRR